ncbi:MAG: GNAT family N-acetyltransferase, partial [Desulfobacterales bacterium]
GWQPRHLTVWSDNRLVAAAPLYLKTHSEGEFVFDHPWVQVAARIGAAYYPKLVGMSPVTPVEGYRFLTAAGESEDRLTAVMIDAIDRYCGQHQIAGCSFLFVDPAWRPLAERGGFVGWRHQGFRWENSGLASFEDYLGDFNSNQRRNIRRERRALESGGFVLRAVAGRDAPRSFFALMYGLYEHTNDQFGIWGCKYLLPAFFEGLSEDYRHRLVFMAAYDRRAPAEPAALSLLLRKGERLYGRYWGSFRRIHALHFNLCYYEPIAWAIQNGIRYFDPGMGGTHKIRRGFRSLLNTSLHRFYDPRMAYILRTNIDRINAAEQEYIEALNAAVPFAERAAADKTG